MGQGAEGPGKLLLTTYEPPEVLTPVPKGISFPPTALSTLGLPPCWVGEEEEGVGSQGQEWGWQCQDGKTTLVNMNPTPSLVTWRKGSGSLPQLQQQSSKQFLILQQGYLQPEWPQGEASKHAAENHRRHVKGFTNAPNECQTKSSGGLLPFKMHFLCFQITCNLWEMFLGKKTN